MSTFLDAIVDNLLGLEFKTPLTFLSGVHTVQFIKPLVLGETDYSRNICRNKVGANVKPH